MLTRTRTLLACAGVALAVLISVMVVRVAGAGSTDLHLAWSDEFNGAAGTRPDPKIWRYATGGDGWGNQELECYTDSAGNAGLNGHGQLVITAIYDPGHVCSDGRTNDYTSAKLQTADLKTVKYGEIKVRAKLPVASGTWPAIWALGTDHDSVGWPKSGEIDIAEKVGSEPTLVHGTVHGPALDGQPYSITAQTHESGPPGEAFHVYEVDWSPTSIKFAVDGRVYSTVTKQAAQRQGVWEFDKPFYLLLDLAVGGTWPGSPDNTAAFPQTMVVDYVRVYE